MYLRATASYTDGDGSGKTLNAVSEHVVGQRASSPPLTVVTFVTGLTVPWDLDFTPDGTMLFTERRGVLKARLTDGAVQEIAADFDDLFVHGHTRTPSAGRGSELCVQPAVLYVAGPHWTRNAGHRLDHRRELHHGHSGRRSIGGTGSGYAPIAHITPQSLPLSA